MLDVLLHQHHTQPTTVHIMMTLCKQLLLGSRTQAFSQVQLHVCHDTKQRQQDPNTLATKNGEASRSPGPAGLQLLQSTPTRLLPSLNAST